MIQRNGNIAHKWIDKVGKEKDIKKFTVSSPEQVARRFSSKGEKSISVTRSDRDEEEHMEVKNQFSHTNITLHNIHTLRPGKGGKGIFKKYRNDRKSEWLSIGHLNRDWLKSGPPYRHLQTRTSQRKIKRTVYPLRRHKKDYESPAF